jgi:CubicO group peptidase (beta-lactamase class C family)
VPALAGSEIGKTPIRALLHMASGIAFKEVYDAPGDNQRLNLMLFTRANPGPAQAVAMFNTREEAPDTRFHYAGIDTEVLGLVVTQAVKMPLTDYMRTRIWQPMGAEADAAWTVDTTGQETAFCCINAVLRDWARVGMMLANDGAWNGKQIVPRQWVLDATTPQAPFLTPGVATRFYGYGYQIWLLPGPGRQFALLGIHGQTIFVDPVSKLVLVHTAVRVQATVDQTAVELRALWKALVARFGG